MTTNYAPILEKTDESIAFHTMQDFLRTSEIILTLQEPAMISDKSVIQIWTTAKLKEGSTNMIHFSHENTIFEITYDVVREALHLPIHTEYDGPVDDEVIKDFFTKIGYAWDMTRLGKLTRPYLRKE